MYLEDVVDVVAARPSDQMNDAETSSLLKTEDDSLQAEMFIQPHVWMSSDSSLGGVSHGLYNSAPHVQIMHPATGMVVDSNSHFSSFPSLKPLDPSPQLQALRDFMAYGSNNNSTPQHPSMVAGLVGPPMFLRIGEETSPGPSLLHLPGMPQMRTFVGENSSSSYRALCQSDLFATERSPHRTQFQRENHILAERQRREEMNEKFSALRAMIPKATKKDKASIVGDTIGYVLELEKTLKHLQACKASRKGYYKMLKRKPSLKRTATSTPDESECDRSMTGTASTPPDLEQTSGAAAEDLDAVCKRLSEDSPDKQYQEMESFDDPIVSSAEKLSACSAGPSQKAKENDIFRLSGTICNSEVDIQNLGEQAVIKIVCARSPGLVLRILLALDECKVDVLQSNVTTVAEKSVHFITVQISSELSSSTEEMIAILHKASRSPDQPSLSDTA